MHCRVLSRVLASAHLMPAVSLVMGIKHISRHRQIAPNPGE